MTFAMDIMEYVILDVAMVASTVDPVNPRCSGGDPQVT